MILLYGRAFIAVLYSLLVSSCQEYGHFELPPAEAPPGKPQYEWVVQPRPVLTPGPAGEWDSNDALNPSIVRTGDTLFNFYSGYDGKTWHTGLATSIDGLTWAKQGKVLSPDPGTWEGDYIAANGTALRMQDSFHYWYQAGHLPRIGLARSRNGLSWEKQAQPVLDVGPRGSWDERGVADPYVVKFDDWLYMYYLGQDRARRQRLGVARSQDGIVWEKLLTNPILELGAPGSFDEVGLGEPAVWRSHGWYWMLYTARDKREHRRLGLARSADGVEWTRVIDAPVLSGKHKWNSAVVCDPSVENAPDRLRVWFGGGDRPEPAENLHGQIGYAQLELSLSGDSQ